jgi:hypothetical protein
MPTIDLTDDEFAALAAVIRRLVEDDRFPTLHASTPCVRRWQSSTRRRES